MFRRIAHAKIQLPLFLGILLLASFAQSQTGQPLLQMQRLRAEVETDSGSLSIGRNAYDDGFRGVKGLDIRQYPNSAACLVVYPDGKYFFEKREEHSSGKPKAKSAGGVLSADDLQHLKAILDDEALKKITTPKAPDLPPQATVLKEAERLDIQIKRSDLPQTLSFIKERVQTGATITGASQGGLTGLDTFLNTGEPYKKTLDPLLKWFDQVGKKNKLKESNPQYCQPIG